MNKKIFALLVAFLFLSISVETLFAEEMRRIGRSYRSLAMGGTGVSSSNDGDALFYNPAAMANIKTFIINVLDIHLDFSKDARDLYNDAKDGGLKLKKQEDKQKFLNKYIGKNPYLRASASIDLVANINNYGFTIGYNYMQEIILDVETQNPVSPNLEIFERKDIVQQVGMSIPLGNGRWILGLGARTINRQILEFDYGINELITKAKFKELKTDGLKGTGSGYDLGLLYRFTNEGKISVGVVARNVGNIDLGDAGKEKAEYDLGLSMSPTFGPFRFTMAFDLKDLTYQRSDDTSLNKRTHIGAELGFIDVEETYSFISVRAGYSQGYPTYGAEISLPGWLTGLNIGYTKYSEETGAYAGQTESIREVYYLNFRF